LRGGEAQVRGDKEKKRKKGGIQEKGESGRMPLEAGKREGSKTKYTAEKRTNFKKGPRGIRDWNLIA